jgi:hypothetical protein
MTIFLLIIVIMLIVFGSFVLGLICGVGLMQRHLRLKVFPELEELSCRMVKMGGGVGFSINDIQKELDRKRGGQTSIINPTGAGGKLIRIIDREKRHD